MFELADIDPDTYQRQTRKISLIVIVLFAVLAMALATLSVRLLGEPGGNNFVWNLGGVLAGLALTIALVRFKLWHQPWMAPAVYGWQLKRNLMRITNIRHEVKARVAENDPDAMKLLRFYHLGLDQMYRLDGNLSALDDLLPEREALKQQMSEHNIPTEQTRLDPAWFDSIKNAPKQNGLWPFSHARKSRSITEVSRLPPGWPRRAPEPMK
ncbi:hypothetical protein CAI21_18755 [Alkalilimnicola ehrlichii]|uniref:DUF3087 domain-containing protein n=1 Tax=Alkalilimnicola ehrlichii TaxID=351052 RepID=A0A3E0WIE2_9GAMM|nr:DUF3087 domain-containing protein [Alkalilimnicola ehrlichii]RFA25567.1 hypothetical protein CAI21_18755 [Alkalilimnicola ehrlichii]RFA32694.1 hypothetical protein CAL65_19005 [Alkalilimnicola ehrlichii]